VFGCECVPTILSAHHKLEPQSKQCVFIGYASNYKGYRCLNPTTGRVYISRHVLFHEDVFLYLILQSPQSQNHNTSPLQLITVPNPFIMDQSPLVVSRNSPVPSSVNTSPPTIVHSSTLSNLASGPSQPSPEILSQPRPLSGPNQPRQNPLPPCWAASLRPTSCTL